MQRFEFALFAADEKLFFGKQKKKKLEFDLPAVLNFMNSKAAID